MRETAFLRICKERMNVGRKTMEKEVIKDMIDKDSWIIKGYIERNGKSYIYQITVEEDNGRRD